MTRRGHADRGFTLIELLVAVFILGTLTVAVSGVLSSTLQSRDRVAEHMDEAMRRANVIRVLRTDLSQMLQPVGVFAGAILGESEELSGMRMDRLEFYASSARPNATEPWGDVQRIVYYLTDAPEEEADRGVVRESANGSMRLVRETTRNLLPSIEEEPTETTLLDGAAGLLIAYYDGDVWQSSWDSSALDDEAPRGVRIRIDLARESGEGATLAPIEVTCEIAMRTEDAGTADGEDGSGAT